MNKEQRKQKIAQEWILNIINILKTETKDTYQDITNMDVMTQLQRTSFGLINIGFDIIHFIIKHLLINVSVNVYNATNVALTKLRQEENAIDGLNSLNNVDENKNEKNNNTDDKNNDKNNDKNTDKNEEDYQPSK
jgi:hypothetical protein